MSEMLQQIVNSKKIKYSILKPLVENNLPSDTEEINVFISLECILKQLYNPRVNEIMNTLQMDEKYLLSSELINIVAHYRHFFWSRYGVPSSYFVMYSNDKATYNCLEVPEYKKNFYDKRVNTLEYGSLNKMIKENLKLANLLSEYLPNIYFINTKDVEPMAFSHQLIKHNQDKGLTNIILSNNTVDYQLVNLDRTFAISLKSDNSFVVKKENLLELFLKGSKKKTTTVLSSDFYVPSLAMSGCKTMNIDGVKGMGKIKSIVSLEGLLKESKISNSKYMDIKPLVKGTIEKKLQKQVIDNFNVLNYENLCNQLTPKQLDNIQKQIDNKSDNQSLMEINRLYYEKYPLTLIELMEGE